MITSAIVNAQLFGQFSVYTEELSKKEVQFQEEFDIANTSMKNLELPLDMQGDVRHFLLNTIQLKDQQNEMKNFQGSISPSLRKLVDNLIFHEMLKGSYVIDHIRLDVLNSSNLGKS